MVNHALVPPDPAFSPAVTPRLVIPRTGPVPPLFAPVVEVGDAVYAVGLHPTEQAARDVGEALQAAHPSLVLREVVELVKVGLVDALAGAYDEMATDPAALGGAA